ncbi:MAG: DAK2 domain-containing protein, partial [Gemmatimonadetes bacterium]|nr:DAK2 domain-containing protein [Gemmatimonadota bacterium]
MGVSEAMFRPSAPSRRAARATATIQCWMTGRSMDELLARRGSGVGGLGLLLPDTKLWVANCPRHPDLRSSMRIGYLDGPRLRRSLVAACEYAQTQRSELNRINVFPVPDGDTGTNLALTVRAIADHLRANTDTRVCAVAREAAEAAVLGARGNCGMMLSHFLLGFAEHVRDRARITTDEFGAALRNGVRNLHQALERPVEGTIL